MKYFIAIVLSSQIVLASTTVKTTIEDMVDLVHSACIMKLESDVKRKSFCKQYSLAFEIVIRRQVQDKINESSR